MRSGFLYSASLLLLLACVTACSSAPKPYEPGVVKDVVGGASIPTGGDPLIAQPLTKVGDNHRPVFSPDGKKILFVSENRDTHKNLQLYEIDIATRAERRITFHDGDVNSAIYTPDGKGFVYSSSTDEIKEDPYFVEDLRKRYFSSPAPVPPAPVPSADAEAAKPAPVLRVPGTLEPREPGPAELYEAKSDGTNIRRLTKSPGFDGEPAMGAKGRYVVYSSARAGRRDLYGSALGNKVARRLTSGPLRDIDPTLTPDGKLMAWVQLSEESSISHIHVADGRSMTSRALTTKAALNVTPFWHPNGQELVFASNRGDGSNFDLYTVDRKGACLKRLTESSSHETHPAFSPDGRKLAFSGNHSGHYQIYIMEHEAPSACLTDLP